MLIADPIFFLLTFAKCYQYVNVNLSSIKKMLIFLPFDVVDIQTETILKEASNLLILTQINFQTCDIFNFEVNNVSVRITKDALPSCHPIILMG